LIVELVLSILLLLNNDKIGFYRWFGPSKNFQVVQEKIGAFLWDWRWLIFGALIILFLASVMFLLKGAKTRLKWSMLTISAINILMAWFGGIRSDF